MSTKSQYRKQNRLKSIKRMQMLMRRIGYLSAGVPQYVLDAMQLESVAWSVHEWVKLGPSQPTEVQLANMMERSAEAQLERLKAYWKEAGRHV
jgi:hypothetical protein